MCWASGLHMLELEAGMQARKRGTKALQSVPAAYQ